jgi:hypothetical protein
MFFSMVRVDMYTNFWIYFLLSQWWKNRFNSKRFGKSRRHKSKSGIVDWKIEWRIKLNFKQNHQHGWSPTQYYGSNVFQLNFHYNCAKIIGLIDYHIIKNTLVFVIQFNFNLKAEKSVQIVYEETKKTNKIKNT